MGKKFRFQNSSYFIIKEYFPSLQTNPFRFKVEFSTTVDYALVTITSKAKTNQTLPYRTKCWASADGDVDPTKGAKLYVNARVEQGNRPVLHAKVE